MDNRGNKVSKNILFKKSGDRKPSLGSNLNKAIMTSRRICVEFSGRALD